MALRPISFSIPSTTQLKVTFSSDLSLSLSADNFKVTSLNGAVDNLEVVGVTIEGPTAIVKTRPQVAGNYYLLKFLDTDEVVFSSTKRETIPFDAVSRELFFVGIDNINPFRDRMYELVPDLFEIENTNLKNILSAQAEEFYTAQKTVGEVLSNNYLCVEVEDEFRTRTAGATDRLSNENAYEVTRVSRSLTGEDPIFEILNYTADNTLPRSQTMPVYPVSLQQVAVVDEVINIDSEFNSFDGFLLSLKNRNIIKLLSVKYIANGEEVDCDGNIGINYDVERYKYSIQDNFYDQDFAFEFGQLEDNQILLSEFGNIPRPSVLDTFIVTYLYKNKGRYILEDEVEVSRVEESINESIPTNSTSFFLDHAPIVDANNDILTSGGVSFRISENSTETPPAFTSELVFDASKLPSKLGEYSINYETGEVFVVGEYEVGEGTGRNNFVASYLYRREFSRDLDYSIYNQDLVATPNRDLANEEAKIFIRYDEVFTEGVDYLAKTHIEVMPEFVENRLSQSFRVTTKNAPITDVFRVFNQTTGEVYNPLFHTDTEIAFSGNRSPEIKSVDSEEVSFSRAVDEELSVVGEFIIPAFRTNITSNISNNNITFSPGIPAELISQNSTDYFFREITANTDDVETKDVNIRFFGLPDANNLITSAGINSSATPPTNGSQVTIGTRGFIINLDNERLINQNLDSIATIVNSSLELVEKDIFIEEKYFEPTRATPSSSRTTEGGLSRAFLDTKGTTFEDNISRLRKVGDYTVDYRSGIVYLAVDTAQDIAIGNASYFYGDIQTRNKNIVTVSNVAKKRNSPDDITEADIIYGQVTHNVSNIVVNDLEDSLFIYDGETTSQDADGNRKNICVVLEDYTAIVPYRINSINSIYNLGDLTGLDLKSSSPSNRVAEYTKDQLKTPVSQGGRNLYEVSSVSFENNIIDFKKKQNRRVTTNGADFLITVTDNTASTFVQAVKVSTGEVVFDDKLNITKLGELQVAGVTPGVGTAIVEIASGVDLTAVDTDNDFLLDANGDRFRITDVDTVLSRFTVNTPAENNVTATAPAIDPLGVSEVVVKPTVSFVDGRMLIDLPSDSGLGAGELIKVTYLTTLIPAIGTPLAIDYRFGFVFADYAYLADEIVVWYEYGDNTLDWSISDSLQEGEDYYVSYKYGALREALRTNFGSLTNIPFFQSFGVDTDRELYRSAIKGTLQAFPKGPTIPAYEELIKSFTKIVPNIDELIFGNWILGRDYLCPGKINYKGILNFAEGKFEEGLIFNDDVVVNVPALSSISLDEGTLEAWVRPDWAGINNDATLTFNLDEIGKETIVLSESADPFDSENDWDLIPSNKVVGGTDSTGSGLTMFNYRSDSDETYGLSQGIFGIYKNQENLSRIISSKFSATMKISMIGSHFNDLRQPITEAPEVIEACEGDDFGKTFFIVGYHGPGSFVEGPWPTSLAAPAMIYNTGSFILPDGYKAAGLSLTLNEVPDFKFEVDPAVADSGIASIVGEEIPKYNRPHYTKGCQCTISNTIPELERFNELTVDVELAEPYDFTLFKSEKNIVENTPEVFVLVDTEGIFFQVVGFYDALGNLITKHIPDSATKFVVKKFGINNPSLSAMGSEAINAMLPTGILRLMAKSVEILTKYDYNNSIQAFNFEKYHVLDWSDYHEYQIIRSPKDNLIDIYIDGIQHRMFYTDAFYSCNLNFGLTVNSEDLRGPLIGILGINLVANLELLRGNGTLYNRYSLEDIHIGSEGFHPARNPFSLNREDFPKSPVGEPPGADTGEGIYIWFDELCKSPLADDAGQWIFRARSDRNIQCPVDVIVDGNSYTNILGHIFPEHTFSGVITTDGEFSSVARAHRDELDGGCDVGVTCNAQFRYCGNELLEDFGWAKIEDSDSDLINVVIGGRETQRGDWRKVGEFTTNNSSGIYRMGPSTNNVDCVDELKGLGNLLYTGNPCYGGSFEYLISLRVAQDGNEIIGTDIGAFGGATSGNITGIVPVHISNEDFDVKIALAYSSAGQPLVLVVDVVASEIVDVIPYIWNDQNFHEYRVERSIDTNKVSIFIDDLLVSEFLVSEFATPTFDSNALFLEPNIALYLFDEGLVDIADFHENATSNIIDVDLIFFSGLEIQGDGYLEPNDILINTDSKIEFTFNIDDADGYAVAIDGYDGYFDGYTDVIGIDEMFITSDRRRFLVDTAYDSADRRFSIFKDGKGFLNFRIYDDSLAKNGQAGLYNLATNIKHFKPGELHHIAASWKLNTIEEKDEMHLFIDGQEAPNIFKFGGKVPVRLNDKFRDVSKEVLYDFLVNDVEFCDTFTDGTVAAGSSIFQSSQVGFTQEMVGRSLIFTGSTLAPDLVGKEYIIKSVIDSTQITLGRGDDMDIVTFLVSTGDIEFAFPPTAGIKAPVLTDLRNSRLAIFRTEPDGTITEMAGTFYTVEAGEVHISRGLNVLKPKFRANLDTRVIEFVGQDSLCNVVATIEPTDIDVHIKTYGLNLENCKHKLSLSSSSYSSGEDLFSGQSVIRSRGAEPVSLEDVRIQRVLMDRTVIDIVDPISVDAFNYQVDFEITLDNENNVNSLTSEPGQVGKQNLGRLITLFFDSDNVDFCEFDGYIDGYITNPLNSITVYGTTTDGSNEETFLITKNGDFEGSKFFTSVERIEGSLLITDPDYFEAALIALKETDPISVSNNGGDRGEVFEYRNGHLILTTAGSGGTFPFELHPGLYNIEYPAHLRLNLPEVGHELFIGSNYMETEQFGGIIDEFRVISELSSDTRVTEAYTSGTRSVTDDYNRTIPYCPDSQTLTLIPFDNPIDLQSRRLRTTKFLDESDNVTYTLSRSRQERLLEIVNDSNAFISQMINWGFSLDDATKTFYEVHRAEGGPLFNEAEFYRNVEEFPKSTKSVNDLFGYSGNFTNGRGLLLLNNDGKFRKNEGTIEFWVSPAIDTFVDKDRRYYVDIFSAKRERMLSKTSTVIELSNAASKIVSVKLLNQTREFADLYTPNEAQTILFDEISRSPISGVLEGGTGTDKDFAVGARLSADGTKIQLAEALPGQKTDVVVTYVPLNSSGDRLSIFKNEHSQLVFGITAGGIDNVVTIDIDWKKNSWHRVMCVYKTNSSFDTMRIFADGQEGGFIRYGTGIIYGEGYIYGQYIQRDGQFRNKEYTIPLGDEFKLIALGANIFGDSNARARIDNIRFSRIIRNIITDAAGNAIDLNYTSNLNTVSPVVEDDATTLMVDFDAEIKKIDRFATVIDPVSGIYNFDVEVIDNFDKVIGVNNGEVEDLIVQLVNRLKPAHTNALVKFTKSRC